MKVSRLSTRDSSQVKEMASRTGRSPRHEKSEEIGPKIESQKVEIDRMMAVAGKLCSPDGSKARRTKSGASGHRFGASPVETQWTGSSSQESEHFLNHVMSMT